MIYVSMMGLTAMYCYLTYQDKTFLDSAVEIWQETAPWLLSVSEAASGSHPLKTATFSPKCNGGVSYENVFDLDPSNHNA